MKNMNCAYANSIDREHTSLAASVYKRVPHTLTEIDIIELHETFLCNGIHYLKVSNIAHGRQILESFLSSLKHYHAIGCLTLFQAPTVMGAGDIFQELANGGYLEKPQSISNYFFDQFDYDFMWIEQTACLSSLGWYHSFSKQLKSCSIYDRMPIVKLLYES